MLHSEEPAYHLSSLETEHRPKEQQDMGYQLNQYAANRMKCHNEGTGQFASKVLPWHLTELVRLLIACATPPSAMLSSHILTDD